MRGVWYGMLMLNTFLLLILADAYVAGKVTAQYPLMVIAAMACCWWAAETQEDKDDTDHSKRE